MHRIYLRKPWSREQLEGTAIWRRRFGRPTGVGPHEQVWIVVEGRPGDALVALNGQPLGRTGGACAARWDVTGRLQSRNELAIHVESAEAGVAPAHEPPAEICLEITSPEGRPG